MLTIVVADDEAFIRNGLIAIIGQIDADYQVVADAANGVEALRHVEALRPDLLITDIKMPKMDGSELIKAAGNVHPAIETIVLSGYDDYELVRETFRSGIHDYLLKPIDKNQLTLLLRQVESKIARRRETDTRNFHQQKQLNESFPLLKEQFLAKLVLNGPHDPKQLQEKLEDYKIDIGLAPYRLLIVRITGYRALVRSIGEDNARIHPFIVQNILEDTLKDGLRCASFVKEGSVVALAGVQPGGPGADYDRLLRTLEANLRQYAKVRFTIAGSGGCSDANALKADFDEAAAKLDHAFYRTESSLVTDRDTERPFTQDERPGLLDPYVFKLHDCIEKGRTRHIQELFRELESKLRDGYYSPATVMLLFAELYTRLTLEHDDIRPLFAGMFGPRSSYERTIPDFDALDDMVRYSVQVYVEAGSKSQSLLKHKEKRWIETVKRYINDHLQEEINLHRAAEQVYLNPNYLSDLFSKETGETFIDYVTRKRIEKAKEYLKRTTARTYEVADMVGYRDSAYFSKVFKKIVGMSPSDYRNRMI